VRKWAGLGIVWLWIVVLFATHWGDRSPYSYGWAIFHGHSARLLGTVVNPDAVVVYPVTLFFYDGETPRNWGDSPNFRLPFHSFVAATAAAFTRSYLLANDLVNVGALCLLALVAVNAARLYKLRTGAVLLALLTIASLPFVVTYIGQPMHYIVGITINFLAVIAAVALSEDDLRKPLLSGLLLAIVMLNYDAYIFAAALAVYILFFVRFRRVADYAIFIVVSVTPVVVWVEFLRFLTGDRVSRMIQRTFIEPIVYAWTEFLKHPLTYPLQPFLAAHVGLDMTWHFVLAMVYWPIVVVIVAGTWYFRREIPPGRLTLMIALLLSAFFLHQVVTAGYDWENNPRRAVPAVFALACVYCWLADRLWPRKAWRAVLIAVLLISGTLAMADVVFDTPVITYLSTGQAAQSNPKEPITIQFMRFNQATMPTLMSDERRVWRDLGRARWPERNVVLPFLFAQFFNAFFCCALLWLLSRARLLSRHAAAIAAIVWLLSAVRFI